jgi:hypothetical protein
MGDEGDKEQHQEHDEQDLGDSGRSYRYAGKAQDRRNQRDDKESYCPVQHLRTPFQNPTRMNKQVGCHSASLLNAMLSSKFGGENYRGRAIFA